MPKLPASPVVDALHRLNDQLAVLVIKEQEAERHSPQMSPAAVFHHGRASAFTTVRQLLGTHIVAAITEATGD